MEDNLVGFIDTKLHSFGWITAEDGERYWFHKTAAENFDNLIAGYNVKFRPMESEKGPKAIGVIRVQ